MNKRSHWVAAAALVAAVSSGAALARYVIVNGERMSPAGLDYLDQISCSRVPDGDYWIDLRTGVWGYPGGDAQGHIADNCNRRQPGLSERGLLYSPGELLR